MGEIRIVGPGKTRGYPYPVCMKQLYPRETLKANLIELSRVLAGDANTRIKVMIVVRMDI